MGTAGGSTPSGSNNRRNLGSEGDHLQSPNAVDQRQQRRIMSNREAARRSRVRKRAQLDDLIADANRLHNENRQIQYMILYSFQDYVNLLRENSLLNARHEKLQRKLIDFYEIIRSCSCSSENGVYVPPNTGDYAHLVSSNSGTFHHAQLDSVHYNEPNNIIHHADPVPVHDPCAQPRTIVHTQPFTVDDPSSQPSSVDHSQPITFDDPFAQPSSVAHSQPITVDDPFDDQPTTVLFEDPNPLNVEDYLGNADTFNDPHLNQTQHHYST
ncbi:BZIP transcription factor [Melia azedarach]|uniref:BZIP transcription factor n=1 Tax=Melia azedarach TaxID=155640 RepID=A0ACC1XUC1_MELAZ|nr:BZIP transcription factor [Melia azedarach]